MNTPTNPQSLSTAPGNLPPLTPEMADCDELTVIAIAFERKWTLVGDEWKEAPPPPQDAAWRERKELQAIISYAKSASKRSVAYFRGAATDTNPVRAARYATLGREQRRKANEYMRWARSRT